MLKEKNIIAVYGTLKRGFWNYYWMEKAGGEFIGEDYVEFDKLDDCGFPMIKFKNNTNNFIKVELFEVPKEGVLESLDYLEGYKSLYDRKKVETLNGKKAIVYEIIEDIRDIKENFLEKKEKLKRFYNWK